MAKQDGAFLTIGELAAELGVAHHILRYWESRFPALRPLQRAGNRRYYRPEDVELARTIHRLLTIEGYTVKGAQQALSGKHGPALTDEGEGTPSVIGVQATVDAPQEMDTIVLLERLEAVRNKLQALLTKS